MKKMIYLILATIVASNLNFSTNVYANEFKKMVEIEQGVYKKQGNNFRSNLQQDDSLIYDHGEIYIELENDIYAKAEKISINIESYDSNDINLPQQTKEVIESIIFDSVDSKVESIDVYQVKNESVVINSLESLKVAAYPVTNEQVRYVSITNEKVIKSGNDKFGNYSSQVMNNLAQLAGSIIAALNPYSNAVYSFINLFPNKYNEVQGYTNWTLGLKLHEEKVVQLTWVTVDKQKFLGAHTEFSTVFYDSIFSSQTKSTIDRTGFIYYRTPNYKNPTDIARKNFNNTWIERIETYKAYGIRFDSLA